MHEKTGDGFWGLAVAALLVVMAFSSLRLFHIVMEFLLLIAAVLVYVFTAWTYMYHRNTFLRIVGIGFLNLALLTFLHILSMPGLQLLTGANHSGLYEWGGSLLQGVSVILALLFCNTRKGFAWAGWLLAIFQAGFIIGCIFPTQLWGIGYKMTVNQSGGRILFGIYLFSAIGLWIRRKAIPPTIYRCLMLAEGCFAAAVISGFVSQGTLGLLIGHGIKVAGVFAFVCGVVYLGIKSPLHNLFSELKSDAISDSLTGLYNRQGFREITGKATGSADRKGHELGLLVMDLDNFKGVNDQFGHMVGDEILKNFGRLLRNAVGWGGVPFRLGGDEFVVLVRDGSPGNLAAVEERIRRAFDRWITGHKTAGILGLSIGAAIRRPGETADMEYFIHEADLRMYQQKRGGRRRGLLRNAP